MPQSDWLLLVTVTKQTVKYISGILLFYFSDKTVFHKLIIQDCDVYAVGWSAGAHVKVVAMDCEGAIKQQKTIPAAWIRPETE